jgi:uncharacterized membrane protein
MHVLEIFKSNTPSVPCYSAYRFLEFVSEYKVVAWIFFQLPPLPVISHTTCMKKIHTKRKELIEIPNTWPQELLRFRKQCFSFLN